MHKDDKYFSYILPNKFCEFGFRDMWKRKKKNIGAGVIIFALAFLNVAVAALPQNKIGREVSVPVHLQDGRKYKQTIVDSGYITRIRGLDHIPFSEDEIVEIIVTHDKWDFRKER